MSNVPSQLMLAVRTMTVDQVLSPYVFIFYAAFLISFCFTPIMRVVASFYGIVDRPDEARKTHKEPVAYLGGVAVFLGWMCGLAISQYTGIHAADPGGFGHVRIPFSLVLGGSAIVALGLWDDLRKISAWKKIAGQALAATFLLARNIGNHTLDPVFLTINTRLHGAFGFQIPDWVSTISSAAFVYFVVVGCCNATNLMDGLDGLCGGVTAVIAGGFLFLAVTIAQQGGAGNANLDGLRIVLGLALLGAVLGFVPYNFNPASIFMGDAGSMLLGFISAVMILLSAQGADLKWFLASMVMFALPVLDTTLAFARRWVNGRPLFSPDRNHFHHQLVARGLTVRQTVLLAYALSFFFAICGGLIAFMRTRFAACFYLVIFGSIIVAAYKMGMVHEQVKKPRSGDTFDANPRADANPPADVAIPSSPLTKGVAAENGPRLEHPEAATVST